MIRNRCGVCGRVLDADRLHELSRHNGPTARTCLRYKCWISANLFAIESVAKRVIFAKQSTDETVTTDVNIRKTA